MLYEEEVRENVRSVSDLHGRCNKVGLRSMTGQELETWLWDLEFMRRLKGCMSGTTVFKMIAVLHPLPQTTRQPPTAESLLKIGRRGVFWIQPILDQCRCPLSYIIL
jgi:hypothetical protein